jgi:hypothetical protein
MHVKRKLMVALAAMIVAGQFGDQSASAATSLDKMIVLQQHLADGNIRDVITFVAENPEMTEGDSPIAEYLLMLVAMYESGGTFGPVSPDLMAFLEARVSELRTSGPREAGSSVIY